jgi:hypothetical protein
MNPIGCTEDVAARIFWAPSVQAPRSPLHVRLSIVEQGYGADPVVDQRVRIQRFQPIVAGSAEAVAAGFAVKANGRASTKVEPPEGPSAERCGSLSTDVSVGTV